MRKLIIRSILVTFLVLAGAHLLIGEAPDNKTGVLSKTNTLEYILFDANQINAWVGNNGEIVSSAVTGDAGLEWPAGSGKTAVFQSGLWLAGKVNGDLRTAASEFVSEFQPGSIIYDPTTPTIPGTPDNPNDARFQVSSINKGDSPDPESSDYNREYATWPASDGAPAHDGEYFTDTDGNGVWDVGEEYEDFNINGQYDGPDGELVTREDPPDILGDQMHWCVYNDFDPNKHSNIFSTLPLGVEVQTTLFGFNRADPLGNIMFLKWKIINKGGAKIDSMFISIWSDSDLGDANDDYIGCDTTISLGYFYNGNPVDQDYGATPPAVGYDFFQGPIVPSPGDTAMVSGKKIADYKNLGMTSFIKYTNGDPDFGDPETALECFNYMKGFTKDGEAWIDPAGNPSKFLYPGDPITRAGWTEYDDSGPQDRRFLICSGPISMESWEDTDGDGFAQVGEPGVQEVVSAIIIAAGTNNLNAITAMKFFDQYAQNAYDTQFNLPSPLKPEVRVSELDQQIILSWLENGDEVEAFSDMGYNFEGYNIYQGESPNGPWHLVNTYDVVNELTLILDKGLDLGTGLILEAPVQFGSDAGIARLIDIRSDKVRGNQDLINNRKYYFAVTSYAYNPDVAPKTVESPKIVITVRPHEPALGEELKAETGQLVAKTHVGIGEAVVIPEVIDPLQLTGETYAVHFDYDSTEDQGYWLFGGIDPVDSSLTDTIIRSAELDSFQTGMIDGFKLTVMDVAFEAPKFLFGWEQTRNIIGNKIIEDTYPAVSPGGVDSLIYIDSDTVKIDTLVGTGNYYDDFETVESGVNTFITLIKQVQHDVLVGGTCSILGAPYDWAGSLFGGGATEATLLQADIEIRFTEEGQNAVIWPGPTYQQPDGIVHVPFEVWDIENNKHLSVGFCDKNLNGTIYNDSSMTLDNDWIVIDYRDYEENKDVEFGVYDNPSSGWLFWFSASSKYSVGDTVRLSFLNPVKAGVDEFVFSPAALNSDLSKDQKEDQLDEINVFPNPYFGFNEEEIQPIARFVTFTHLPKYDCKIRIYTLGGQLVKKIDHNRSVNSGTSIEQWDLRNQRDVPVASGMYLVYIEIDGVGGKALKLAIFQPEERLDVY